MTESSYPKAETPLDIIQWREYHKDDTGVIGSIGGTERQIFVDASGMNVKRRAGAVMIQGVRGEDDDEKQLTVAANSSGQWRVDRVVDRLDADGLITTAILTGTPGATPTAPALTQTAGGTWEESLGTFRVKTGAVTITTTDAVVVDERRFVAARITPVASEAMRPASPQVGDGVELADGRRQTWNGAAWVTTWSPQLLTTPGFTPTAPVQIRAARVNVVTDSSGNGSHTFTTSPIFTTQVVALTVSGRGSTLYLRPVDAAPEGYSLTAFYIGGATPSATVTVQYVAVGY